MNKIVLLLFLCTGLTSCSGNIDKKIISPAFIHPQEHTIKTRFSAPAGFTQTLTEKGSFAHYLQNLPLKPEGTPVYLYNKAEKRNKVHAAVVDLEIGDKDLQQCADAIMRLRAEYLFHAGKKNKIAFHFTNGFLAGYSEWANGNRMKVQGNTTQWVKKAEPDDSYAGFRKYMELVFTYAGTRSLEKELKPVDNINELQIGDVFIQGGSPGHAVIVVNVAENTKGEKVFMLAQSYMPAQDIHVLINRNDPNLSPWYRTDFGNELQTPEWNFTKNNLKRF